MSPKGTIIRLLALKRYDLFFGTKSRECLQQKDTIYISEPRIQKGVIYQHDKYVTFWSFVFFSNNMDPMSS